MPYVAASVPAASASYAALRSAGAGRGVFSAAAAVFVKAEVSVVEAV